MTQDEMDILTTKGIETGGRVYHTLHGKSNDYSEQAMIQRINRLTKFLSELVSALEQKEILTENEIDEILENTVW